MKNRNKICNGLLTRRWTCTTSFNVKKIHSSTLTFILRIPLAHPKPQSPNFFHLHPKGIFDLTRLHGLCSATVADDAFGPLLWIDCESCIGFIGGGNSNVTSSSASNSPVVCWLLLVLLLPPLAFDWAADVVGIANLLFTDAATDPAPLASSSVVIDEANLSAVANLNVFSEPFFTSGRSAALVVLSTFPWDSFRSGGGNHFRLLWTEWRN